jgi:mRNA export factor
LKDGTLLAAGGADKQIHLLHGATGQANVIGSHDAPVRGVRFINVPSSSSLIVATGSWDKTVRYWDMRQAGRAIATLACAERVYSMDTASHLLVIATADRHIHLVDLQSDPMKFSRTVQSPLKYQTRAVAAFPNGMGWGTAGIEGRSGINAVKADTSVDFTFRCHRDPPDAQNITKVWAVNDIRFHPIYETTFSTAGADGTFHFWDRIKHQRLKSFKSVGGAITATDFSHDGSMFAYAVGYDWSFGYAANTPGYPLKWMLHRVAEGEVNPKKK